MARVMAFRRLAGSAPIVGRNPAKGGREFSLFAWELDEAGLPSDVRGAALLFS